MMLHRAADRTALLHLRLADLVGPRDHRFRRDGPRSSVRCAGPDDLAARSAVAAARSLGIAAHSPVDRLAEKNSPV